MHSSIIFSISLLLILTGSIHSSFASSQNSTLDSQGNYANPSLGISFQAPPGWTVEEPKKSQLDAPDIAVIAPYSSGFTASISFIIEKSNGTLLDDYVKNKANQLTGNQSNNITFLSEQDDTISGLPAKVSILQENFTSQGSSNVIKFKQTVILANDKFYTITYANDKKNFDSDLSSYDQLLSSIKFVSDDTSYIFNYLSIGIVGIAVAAGMAIMRKKTRSQKTHSRRQS
ncbi:MAG: hypothetical protein KGI25_03860 [Thaumarchaeota archaeon]|nr:hypothetical protein [Nitrososphaerota archaeon]